MASRKKKPISIPPLDSDFWETEQSHSLECSCNKIQHELTCAIMIAYKEWKKNLGQVSHNSSV